MEDTVKKHMTTILLCCAALAAIPAQAWGAEQAVAGGLRQVEQYNFSIHVLAMLLVGFGFLMVFVKKHGYSATTGTYLVVATGIPLPEFVARKISKPSLVQVLKNVRLRVESGGAWKKAAGS